MKRFIKALILCILAIIIAAYAVANRDPVTFVLDPISPFSDKKLVPSVEAPLFVFLFIAMFAGMFLGGLAVWAGQGRWRKAARRRSREAAVWKLEAEKLKAGLQSTPGTAITPAAPRPARSYS